MKALRISLVVSVALNLWLLFGLVSSGAELDSARVEQSHTKEARVVSLKLLSSAFVGQPVESVEKIGTQLANHGVVYKHSNGELVIGDLIFSVSEGKIQSVSYMN